MSEMRKLINIMESAMVKEENPKGPPQEGTREYDQMHQTLYRVNSVRSKVADIYRRWPNYDADSMLAALLYIQEQLQRPMQILDRMEIDKSGREFRVQNQPWSILAQGDESTFRKLIGSEQVGPEGFLNMFKAMDRDLGELVVKLNPRADTRPYIKQ